MREWNCRVAKLFPEGATLGEVVKSATRFSDEEVQKLIDYGAVTVKFRGRGSQRRVRDPRIKLTADDLVNIYYDKKVLSLPPLKDGECLFENKSYGVWLKPAGILSQGTKSGDQTSMMYLLEKKKKTPFLIHRLDRETEGPMVFAYDGKAAAQLSELFRGRDVRKVYQAVLVGDVAGLAVSGEISTPIDGQEALTKFKVVQKGKERAWVEFEILTGRLHQIRRHVLTLGCPVWGDPKYGSENKNREGMKLAATLLSFPDPVSGELRKFEYTVDYAPFLL